MLHVPSMEGLGRRSGPCMLGRRLRCNRLLTWLAPACCIAPGFALDASNEKLMCLRLRSVFRGEARARLLTRTGTDFRETRRLRILLARPRLWRCWRECAANLFHAEPKVRWPPACETDSRSKPWPIASLRTTIGWADIRHERSETTVAALGHSAP
jgi:hypothetical protein